MDELPYRVATMEIIDRPTVVKRTYNAFTAKTDGLVHYVDAIDTYRREVEAHATAQHPAIPCLLATDDSTPQPSIALEYRHGQTLEELMRNGKPSDEQLQRCTTDIGGALAELERNGFIIDARPETIVAQNDGSYSLRALENARRIRDLDYAAPLVPPNAPAKHSRYLAPETQHETGEVSANASLYGLAWSIIDWSDPGADRHDLEYVLRDRPEALRNALIRAADPNPATRTKDATIMLRELVGTQLVEPSADEMQVNSPGVQLTTLLENWNYELQDVSKTVRERTIYERTIHALQGMEGNRFAEMLLRGERPSEALVPYLTRKNRTRMLFSNEARQEFLEATDGLWQLTSESKALRRFYDPHSGANKVFNGITLTALGVIGYSYLRDSLSGFASLLMATEALVVARLIEFKSVWETKSTVLNDLEELEKVMLPRKELRDKFAYRLEEALDKPRRNGWTIN